MTTRSRTALVCGVCLALIGGVIEGRSRTADGSSLSVSIVDVPTSALQTGQAFTFTAAADGSTAPLEYSFWLLDASGWTCVRAYDPWPSFAFTPAEPGHFALQAWTRHAGSSNAYEAWTSIAFEVVAAPLSVQVTTTTTFPSPASTPIMWIARANAPGAQYQFWRLDGSWLMVRDYAADATFTWTPAVGDAGEHTIQVWVRAPGSTFPYDAWAGTDFFTITSAPPQPPVRLISVTTNTSFPATAGFPITWTAAASGGSGSFEYQFWRLDGNVWSLVQDYSPQPEYVWIPTGSDGGSHVLQVWVRRAGSTAPYEDWRGFGEVEIASLISVQMVSLAVDATFPVAAGTTITWTADGGGRPGVEYQFWRLDASGWTMVRDYQTDAVYSWQPGAGDSGAHAVQVWAREVGSSALYEAWTGFGSFDVLAAPPASCSAIPALAGACFQPVASYSDHDYLADLVVRTPADIASRRTALIRWIWGTDRLPDTATLPANSLETNIAHPDIEALHLPNLERVDRFRIDVAIPADPADEGAADRDEAPIASHVYEFVPTVSNHRLLVLHQGHVADAHQAFTPETMLGADGVLRMFLERGYTVLYLQMPLIGDNLDPRFELSATSNPHELLGARKKPGFNPLVAFLHPVRVAINYARRQQSFTDVSMLGISGGGWTTTVYAALDPDVVNSFPVAGSLPLSMNHGLDDPCAHDVDWEQRQFPVAALNDDPGQPLGYLDLYLMGSTRLAGGPARQQIQILNRYDPCCFTGAKVEGTYETSLRDFSAGLGGSYRLAIDATHTQHLISECALSSIVLPAIERQFP